MEQVGCSPALLEIFQFQEMFVLPVFQFGWEIILSGHPDGHHFLSLSHNDLFVAGKPVDGLLATQLHLVILRHILIGLEGIVHQALHVAVVHFQVNFFIGYHDPRGQEAVLSPFRGKLNPLSGDEFLNKNKHLYVSFFFEFRLMGKGQA